MEKIWVFFSFAEVCVEIYMKRVLCIKEDGKQSLFCQTKSHYNGNKMLITGEDWL